MRLRFFALFLISLVTTLALADEVNLAPFTLQWSPDGQWIARGYTDGVVLVTYLSNSDASIELKHDGVISNISWSPDSSRLAVSLNGDGHISIWNIDTQVLLKVLEGDFAFNGGGTHLAWNPNREILVSVAREYDGGMQLRFWDTNTYTLVGNGGWVDPRSIQWNADGTLLAVTSIEGGLEIYDSFIGDHISSRIYLAEIAFVDWSPVGTYLAALKYKTHHNIGAYETESWLTIVDTATLKEIAQITEPIHNTLAPIFWSPDGQRIAVLHGSSVDVIDAVSGALLDQWTTSPYLNVAWSPFGGRLAIGGAEKRNSVIEDVQIVVPAPSLDLLQDIQSACVPSTSLIHLPDTDDLTTYIEAIKADTSIPPACAADLIAVAEALLAE